VLAATAGAISVGDTNVNQQLVAGGGARHYKQARSDQPLTSLESQEKSAPGFGPTPVRRDVVGNGDEGPAREPARPSD